jgi:hypothetical protein
MRRNHCLLTIAILASSIAFGGPLAARAEVPHCTITEFYVYPAESPEFNKLAGFTWPQVNQLNALVRVDVGGYSGEQKVDLFLVVFDENDQIVSKHKGKHFLAAGTHDLLFTDFISTASVFGEHNFMAKVEASLKGCEPVQREHSYSITGPDPPDVEILDISVFSPLRGRADQQFFPGDEFRVEAEVEVSNNASDVAPKLILYGMLEEDSYTVDPTYEYQPYELQWDSLTADGQNGVWRIAANGHLPLYFAQPYDFRHPFRIYMIVDFGGQARTIDYERAELLDYDSGEQRKSDEVTDRLIELDRSYSWEVRQMRGEKPHTSRD